MIRKILLAGTAIAAATAALPAAAAPILFELTGSRTATFIIDPVATAPSSFLPSTLIGDQFSYNSVAGTFGGVQGNAFVGFGSFLTAPLNIQSPNLGFTQFTGPDLFTTVNGRPVFKIGTFQLSGLVSGSSTLKISSVSAAVPEPMSWALMTVGFGFAGAALRYRRRSTIATVSFA